MNKIITALAAVALIAAPLAASARDFDGGRGGGHYDGVGRGGGDRGGRGYGGDRDYRGGNVGAALLGGLALGALIGGSYNAYNTTPYAYGNGYGYGYAPAQSCAQWVWNPRAGRYIWANVC
ncbi:MAG TPA: hypothetical protein VG960_13050 [Caulobacteraceae bacterium]|nr:hypothetical protein [Caulobacteraceae bacterium]